MQEPGRMQFWKYLMRCAWTCISQYQMVCSCSQSSGHTEERASVWKSHFHTPTVWVFNSNTAPNRHLLSRLVFGFYFLPPVCSPSPSPLHLKYFSGLRYSGRNSRSSSVPETPAWPRAVPLALLLLLPAGPARATRCLYGAQILYIPLPGRTQRLSFSLMLLTKPLFSEIQVMRNMCKCFAAFRPPTFPR